MVVVFEELLYGYSITGCSYVHSLSADLKLGVTAG
jgi:hypothetical protein